MHSRIFKNKNGVWEKKLPVGSGIKGADLGKFGHKCNL